jgi:hypothetical protein
MEITKIHYIVATRKIAKRQSNHELEEEEEEEPDVCLGFGS